MSLNNRLRKIKDMQNKKELTAKESSKAIVPHRVKTIKLQNKDYAQVSDRVSEFNKLYKNGSITTVYEFNTGWVIFKATIILDVKNDTRIFTGTSLGKAGAQKAFEKLETIAVGRALAFAGFLSSGEIASSEEMDRYQELVSVVDEEEILEATITLESAQSMEELSKIWKSFSQVRRENAELIALKNKLKAKYENPSSRTTKPGVVRPAQRESNGNGSEGDNRDSSSTQKV